MEKRAYRRHYVTSWGETVVGLKLGADGRFRPIGRSDVAFGSDERRAVLQFRQWQAREAGQDNTPTYKAIEQFQRLFDNEPGYTGPGKAALLDAVIKVPKSLRGPDDYPPVGDLALFARIVFEETRNYFGKLILANPRRAAVELNVEQLAWIGQLNPPAPSLPLTEIGDAYLDKQPPLSAGWRQKSKSMWAEFVECVDVKTVRDVGPDEIQRYHSMVLSAGKSPTHAAHRFACVKSVFAYALRRGKDQTELSRVLLLCKMLVPPRKAGTNPHPISPQHFTALSDAADVKWRAMLLLSLNAAMYPSELAAVQERDVDLEAGTLVCERGKTGIVRVAVLWPRTIAAIKAYLKVKRYVSDSLFVGRTGAPYDGTHVSRGFRTIRDDAGVPDTVQFADIRDGAFTNAFNADGVEEKHARLVAGHRSGMSDHYVKRNPRCVAPACAAIEAEYFSA